MAGFKRDVWIAANPDDIFAYATNPEHAQDVMEGVEEMTQLTPGDLGRGTRFRETRRINGKAGTYEMEVVAYEPPRRYAMQSVHEGIEVVYTYTFLPEGDGTRVELSCSVAANGFKRLWLPMVAKALQKVDGEHLDRLKSAIQSA